MKKMKNICMSLMVGVMLLSANSAFAGGFVSHHYHRGQSVRQVRHSHGPTYIRRVYTRPVVYRPVYYRPIVQPVIAHYHYGYLDPCYDTVHETGIYWNVNVNNGGLGFSVGSGW